MTVQVNASGGDCWGPEPVTLGTLKPLTLKEVLDTIEGELRSQYRALDSKWEFLATVPFNIKLFRLLERDGRVHCRPSGPTLIVTWACVPKGHWSYLLAVLGACKSGVTYALTFDSFDEAYANCQNIEWIEWVVEKLGVQPVSRGLNPTGVKRVLDVMKVEDYGQGVNYIKSVYPVEVMKKAYEEKARACR